MTDRRPDEPDELGFSGDSVGDSWTVVEGSPALDGTPEGQPGAMSAQPETKGPSTRSGLPLPPGLGSVKGFPATTSFAPVNSAVPVESCSATAASSSCNTGASASGPTTEMGAKTQGSSESDTASSPAQIYKRNWFTHLFGCQEYMLGKVSGKPKWVIDYTTLAERFEFTVIDAPVRNVRLDVVGNVAGERRSFNCGYFEMSTYTHFLPLPPIPGKLTFQVKQADIQDIIKDPLNDGATIQVASQFNYLETLTFGNHPNELGITGYQDDRTQGPAVSIACGPGTFLRQYGLNLTDPRGQPSAKNNVLLQANMRKRQLNGLSEVLRRIKEGISDGLKVNVNVKNGYLMIDTEDTLEAIDFYLQELGSKGQSELGNHLNIGTLTNTVPTSTNWGQNLLENAKHTVNLAFCSSVPIQYCINLHPTMKEWELLVSVITRASFDCVLAFAAKNAKDNDKKEGKAKVFLTLLGGGAFGVYWAWILDALSESLHRHSDLGLSVTLVLHDADVYTQQCVQKYVTDKMREIEEKTKGTQAQ